MTFLPTDQLPLWANVMLFVGASIVVWIAGTRLTNYVDVISEVTGLGSLFAGMLLLGVITSLPEVANAVSASSAGNPSLAINNLLGSAAINILMLAIGDAMVRRDALTSVAASPSTLMIGVLCILVLVVVAIALNVGDIAIFGVGAWSLAIAGTSIGCFWLAAGYEERSKWRVANAPKKPEDHGEPADAKENSLPAHVWKTVAAGVVIFLAGITLSETGDTISDQAGIGSDLVGFALIGIATSTPELSTVIQSLRLKRYEMAFGQVLGTNFVNLSLILLADAFFEGGPVINELGRFEITSSLLGASLISIFLIGLLERKDRTIFKMGYDSFAVIVLFIAGLGLLSLIGE